GGDILKNAVAAGIIEAGGGVVDVGMVPTPTVGVIVRRHELAGGVVITASHNPEQYNGLKFFSRRGVFLDGEEVAGLFAAVDAAAEAAVGAPRSARDADASEMRGIDDAVGEHVALVLASPLVNAPAVSAARPRIVVDCVNAAGSVILPRLLRELGCEVVELYTDTASGFPRGAEPIPEHLEALSRAVVAESAVAGFACDPDADRLALVDERGTPIGEEFTLAIAARVVLDIKRGPIVANMSTSRMMDDLAQEFEVPIHRTPIGEINVVAKMEEVGAVVGGEGNGGVILPDVHMGRDSATAAALVASGMAMGKSGALSELATRFTHYFSVKKKLSLDCATREGIIAAMRNAFPDGELDLTDGAKIAWPDRWIHARMSGTEPVVRVIAEATREDDADRLVEEAISAVTSAAGGA
ncbi:phosphoglucosamine mutase, partial [bacterium]|nr:phosphoglucosamine mutase [bacterium]